MREYYIQRVGQRSHKGERALGGNRLKRRQTIFKLSTSVRKIEGEEGRIKGKGRDLLPIAKHV